MYCADVGALTASKLTGLNKNTTHRLYGLLRARVVEMAKVEAAPFTGSVEVGGVSPCMRAAGVSASRFAAGLRFGKRFCSVNRS